MVNTAAATLRAKHDSRMRSLSRYGAALLLVAVAALIQTLYAALFSTHPFFLFFGAVFVAAVFCGYLPALVATGISSALVVIRMERSDTLNAETVAQTVLFIVIGVALATAVSKRQESRKRAEDSLRLLNQVSDILSASLDYAESIPAAAALAVKKLGDWCAVTFVDDEGVARRVAVVHRDSRKRELAQKLLTDFPPRRHLPQEVAESINMRRPTILNTLDDQFVARAILSPEHEALVRELGFGSMLVAPMVARDHLIGVISFVSARPGCFDAADADLAELIARRAALAIDNAQLYRAAVEASNAKDEFLATVSHELRTPMTATLGWVRMLSLGHFDPETHKTALDAIERSTRAQAKLIEDILDVSSITLGRFRLDREPVDLRGVVDAAIETLRPASEAKQIAIDVDTSRWSGVVQGDADRLQQVIWNLVSNAIKFGRRNGHIDVVVERVADHARISVRDDGPGIDPAFLPRVFDRFSQADSSATRSHGGLGLGLSIVRHLTELHGGSVRAVSDGAGKGATFIVELPANDAPAVLPLHLPT
jgi:signal transduction histidine kinase